MYSFNPLSDPRWPEFVGSHPNASVFHSKEWLQVLHETFGYTPVVITSSQPGDPLRDGVVFCEIDSWLTGHRYVSLPFADHCEPLTAAGQDAGELLGQAIQELEKRGPGYIECRPQSIVEHVAGVADCSRYEYWFHQLDLTPPLETLFHALHKDSIQRKIRRAEREGLIYREGRTDDLLRDFYGLFMMTRKRHGLPPHPMLWFRNLIRFLGDAMKIRVAYQGSRAVAAMVTLQHGQTMVYKYGASDPTRTNLGGTPLLMWRTIEDAKQQGLKTLDLGRSDLAGAGLILFKNRWNATASKLSYVRSGKTTGRGTPFEEWTFDKEKWLREAMMRLPTPVLKFLGNWVSRHAG